jgi:(heptosyl)LPS beta-1,4-glucosyltransferase
MKISAVIAINDERETYMQALKSVQSFVDEVLVADIGMPKDMFAAVKKLPKARILKINKPLFIELVRQELIDHAHGDWILLMDADEVFPKTLMSYLLKEMDHYDYFSIPRKNIILGQWMRHSRWWPDPQIRFFRKSSAKWEKEIHSQPTLNGHGHEVPSSDELAIEHYNYLNYDQYLEKAHRYARAEAQGYIDRNEDLTILKALQRGVSEFISRYFKDDGYQDGTHGFVMAFSQLMYYFQVYVYYWEMKGYPPTPSPELKALPATFFSHALHESLHWSRVKGMVTDPVSKVKAAILKRL